MKKTLALISGLILILMLAGGCAGQPGLSPAATSSAPGDTQTQPTSFNPAATTLPAHTTSTTNPTTAPLDGTATPGTGKLIVMVKDPPAPEVARIWVDVANLEIHRAGGTWQIVQVDMEPFDLKAIVELPAFLAENIVEAGIYTQIRLDVANVVVETGTQEPYEIQQVEVPSGRIRLVGAFEVVEGGETRITIDFNGEKSLNVTGNDKYIFKPVVKLLIPDSAKPSGDSGNGGGGDEAQTLTAVSYQSTEGATAELAADPEDSETPAVHLETTSEVGSGSEAGIVIELPEGTTLEDIESVSWWIWTAAGYPPHLDIVMDHDGDDVVDEEDILTAEMAYNNFAGAELDSTPPLSPVLGEWLQTFELTSGDGYGDINNDTMLWVTRLGAGNDDAPWGTLFQWKAGGAGVTNPPENGDTLTGSIAHDAEVLRLEIEIDNWVLQSEAYVKGIEIVLDGTLYLVELT
ncbi:MAG: DUF4382 domain-containing protein [Dehalococcoidaceae bacterium]|nr:DUF4382 domain-containing protein [Dehalococcoidaceae bacterium]